jgi:hypothetical protein
MLLVPVQEIVENKRNEMFSNLSLCSSLGIAIIGFETEIRERWPKISVAQRTATLRTAWPRMSLHHRPDIDHCVLNTCPHQRHTRGLGAYAFPHHSLEDLAKGNPFLILLNACGRHSLFKFGFLDYKLAPLIQLRPALLEKTKYTIGLTTEDYGQIFKWDSEEAASESMSKGDLIHPVPGSHTLTMHHLIYSCFVKCVRGIMRDKSDLIMLPFKRIMDSTRIELTVNESDDFAHHSITLSPRLADQHAVNNRELMDDTNNEPPLPKLPPLVCNEQDFISLSAIVWEACYQVPTLAGLRRLEALVSACKDAAKDHIWMLREDPEYFRDSIMEFKDNRPLYVERAAPMNRSVSDSASSVWWKNYLKTSLCRLSRPGSSWKPFS